MSFHTDEGKNDDSFSPPPSAPRLIHCVVAAYEAYLSRFGDTLVITSYLLPNNPQLLSFFSALSTRSCPFAS